MIQKVTNDSLLEAATIHSISWQESHKNICKKDFIELHTPKHQEDYFKRILKEGATLYMLTTWKTIMAPKDSMKDMVLKKPAKKTSCPMKYRKLNYFLCHKPNILMQILLHPI